MITNDELKKAILDTVNTSTGINGVQLVMTVMNHVGPTSFEHDEFHLAINRLVNEKQVVELEYVLPNMEYRVKSMYFPKGTLIIGNNDIVGRNE